MSQRIRFALAVPLYLVLCGSVVQGAPITGGTGPGGVGTTDGASNLALWLRSDVGVRTGTGAGDRRATRWPDGKASAAMPAAR